MFIFAGESIPGTNRQTDNYSLFIAYYFSIIFCLISFSLPVRIPSLIFTEFLYFQYFSGFSHKSTFLFPVYSIQFARSIYSGSFESSMKTQYTDQRPGICCSNRSFQTSKAPQYLSAFNPSGSITFIFFKEANASSAVW